MANDRHVIQYLSPVELVGLMKASGIAVHDVITADGKPVIHAALKVVNAETGEHLPGGLPFSVVMFKSPSEAGYSNIAIGTIVPATELNVRLPRDYFNFCNQRFRFCRAFPVDERSFVIQMDLVLKNATREYVKFAFGLWGALFSQMLFELIGRGRESLISAAEAYAQAHTDFAQHIATTPDMIIAEPEPVAAPEVAVAETEAQAEVLPLEVEAIIPQEVALDAEAPKLEEPPAENPVAAPALMETATAEVPAEDVAVAADLVTQPVELIAPGENTVEVPDAAMETTDLELSIAAGPAVEALPEAVLEPKPEPKPEPEPEIVAQTSELAEDTVIVERDDAKEDAKEVVPA